MENQRIYDFRQLSCKDVRSLVQKSAKKTCTLDPIPTSMVVACLEELLSVITCILNSSLGSGHSPPAKERSVIPPPPSPWKEALVDPRLIKSRKDVSFSNLRPVSNLQLYQNVLSVRYLIRFTST